MVSADRTHTRFGSQMFTVRKVFVFLSDSAAPFLNMLMVRSCLFVAFFYCLKKILLRLKSLQFSFVAFSPGSSECEKFCSPQCADIALSIILSHFFHLVKIQYVGVKYTLRHIQRFLIKKALLFLVKALVQMRFLKLWKIFAGDIQREGSAVPL